MPIHCSETLRKPWLPNKVIQPAARTALPTNSGSTSSMIMQVLVAALRARQLVGERKGQQQAEHGDDHRDPQRAIERGGVVRVGEEQDVVLERPRLDHQLAGNELVEAVAEQDDDRNEQADRHEDRGRPDQHGRGRQPPAAPFARGERHQSVGGDRRRHRDSAVRRQARLELLVPEVLQLRHPLGQELEVRIDEQLLLFGREADARLAGRARPSRCATTGL